MGILKLALFLIALLLWAGFWMWLSLKGNQSDHDQKEKRDNSEKF